MDLTWELFPAQWLVQWMPYATFNAICVTLAHPMVQWVLYASPNVVYTTLLHEMRFTCDFGTPHGSNQQMQPIFTQLWNLQYLTYAI